MPWLLALAFLLVYEGWALYAGRRTLSRMMVDASRAWPLLPFVVGLAVGVLATHFWWPWGYHCVGN